jgi:hypothetical protein
VVAAVIVKITGLLAMPDIDAVILTVPVVRPVTKPVEEIVATDVLELIQVTSEVTFIIELSE